MTSTFGPGLAVDPVTLAPVPNAQLRVLDAQGVGEYSTQNLKGEDRLVFTDHRGQYPQFQIAESVPVATLTSPPYMQRIVPLEVLQRAPQAIPVVTNNPPAPAPRPANPRDWELVFDATLSPPRLIVWNPVTKSWRDMSGAAV